MNRPVFPRIPEARRRAQERASARARVPVENPVVPATTGIIPSRDPAHPAQRGDGIALAPLEPGASDSGGAP